VTGLLLVDKPEAVTSAGVIRALKRVVGREKIGHLGTLDPFASGLLPLCLGEATKVARWLLLEEKTYTGLIRLGSETDTLDRTGTPTRRAAVPSLDAARLADVAARFLGPQEQVPPMFSALKRDGVPLYALARRGIEVERTARAIDIRALALELVAPDAIGFGVSCSKGTYVRVLAQDIGRALETAAHLETLRRTAVGRFRLDDALSPDDLAGRPAGAPLPLVGIRDALAHLPAFALDAEHVARLRLGQQAALAGLPPPAGPDAAAVGLDPVGAVVALLEPADANHWRIARLLAPH
jgi:tRNA pseudouridine55 synthase